MPYLMSDLIKDVLPRLGRMENKPGITIWAAVNAVQAMLYKRLLERRSDLLASGDLAVTIAAQGYYATLPTDLLALAEKPKSQEIYTDWMSGYVYSYNSNNGQLIAVITNANGNDSLNSWSIAKAPLPGNYSEVIGSSNNNIAVGTGNKTLIATTGMNLNANEAIYIIPTSLPTNLVPQEHRLEPTPLDEDSEHEDYTWWEWYGFYGETWETPALRPQRYRIIGTTIYVRPKVLQNVSIVGKYFKQPSALTAVGSTIPYNGMFDEVFREGVVRVIQKGIIIPESDQDFVTFIHSRVDSVLNARVALQPETRRLRKANWL